MISTQTTIILMLLALPAGFVLDLLFGDPLGACHPVVLIGKLISACEKLFRRLFPKTKTGENLAGMVLWITVCVISFGVPFVILALCYRVNPWLYFAAETFFCWQMLAVRSLKNESMKVYDALETGGIGDARAAVSMIVGRDTERLDDAGVTKAAVETVAENTSDGVAAPILYFAVGGSALGFLYKAVNTMDSMLGYIEQPYKNIGLVPAKLDDVFNFIPSRIAALFMLAAGKLLGMDSKNGWRIFKRDRYNHASPNSAQTESVCAGLLRVQLGGDAWYHKELHKKKTIGDDLRPVEHEDIPRSCRLLYGTSLLTVVFGTFIRWALLWAAFLA